MGAEIPRSVSICRAMGGPSICWYFPEEDVYFRSASRIPMSWRRAVQAMISCMPASSGSRETDDLGEGKDLQCMIDPFRIMAEIADHLFHDAGNHHPFVRCGSLWLFSNRILIHPFVHCLPLRMHRAPLYAFSPFVDGGVLIVVCGGFILAARIIQKRNMMKEM